MIHRLALILGGLLGVMTVPVQGATLFDESAVLNIELTGPLHELQSDENGRERLPFTLRADDTEHSIDVRLRGNSRRRVCSFPPLRLSFKKKTTINTVFEDQKHLKLVTHCRDSNAAQQNVLEEYLAYRIFNLLSEKSFRVRLVRATYVDTDPERADEKLQRYGYIIESDDELAERIGARKAKQEGVSRTALEPRQAALVFIFHYLIGNTDWSLVRADTDKYCCHNGELFKTESDLILVPYDFDLSGLVHAKYAKPDPDVGLRSVRSRKYRGYCLPNDELPGTLQAIMNKESDILALPPKIPGFGGKEEDSALEYLEAFFKDVQDIEKIAQKFESQCL